LKIVSRGDSFGIALLSKYPLENVIVMDESDYDIPAISATMTWEEKKVEVRTVHPHPPFSGRTYAERNNSNHAAALVAPGRPALMAGDFNSTPWSTGVSVVQDAGLVRATSLAPTWPAHSVVPAVFPIDHITVSKHWGVLSKGRGPNIGSDHYPVMATVYQK
jgi:endonuclease/exonuclease/phosphatase (EEP) superfamily protein YafD